MDFFQVFPTEVCEKIIRLLDVRDLLNCSLVSKSWRTNVNMDIIWREHCYNRRFLPKTITQIDPDFVKEQKTPGSILEPLCRWRKIFAWHNRLRNNWIERNFIRHSLSTKKCDSPVFCVASDGLLVASGHEDGSANVWKLHGEPHHVDKFIASLSSVPVISICVWSAYIILLQRRLLQIYRKTKDGYELVDAKTFELGVDKMSVMDKINILGDSFDYWYKECLRVNEIGHFQLRRLIFEVCEGLVLTAISGSSELGVWKLDGAPRASLMGFHSIRCILVFDKQAYIVSDCGDTLLSKYSFSQNESETVLRIPGWKKILLSEQFIIAVPNRMDTTLKRMWVWDRNHTIIRTRKLAFGHVSVAPVGPVIVYTENSNVTVWNPRTDTVLNTFYAGSTIGFIKPAFSTLMVMFLNASVHVWDFMEGKRLYRVYSELEWHGDFRDQLWLNPRMIVAGGVNKQIELLSFIDER